MRRTQISLTDEDRRVLDAEARRSGRSLSALIGDAIATTYGRGIGDVESDLRAIANASGRGASGSWTGRRRPTTVN